MFLCDLMWELFRRTGHIGAYLLYKDHRTDYTLQAATSDKDEHEGNPVSPTLPLLSQKRSNHNGAV